jgi:hypothetical protein
VNVSGASQALDLGIEIVNGEVGCGYGRELRRPKVWRGRRSWPMKKPTPK